MSDKITVDIKDFQSLKKAYIELTPGITVITGATNNGKKANTYRAKAPTCYFVVFESSKSYKNKANDYH